MICRRPSRAERFSVRLSRPSPRQAEHPCRRRVRTHGTMIRKVRARCERDECVHCVRVITRCRVGVTELNWLQHRRSNAGHRARKKASVMKRATAAENKCTRVSPEHNHACGYITTFAYVHKYEIHFPETLDSRSLIASGNANPFKDHDLVVRDKHDI